MVEFWNGVQIEPVGQDAVGLHIGKQADPPLVRPPQVFGTWALLEPQSASLVHPNFVQNAPFAHWFDRHWLSLVQGSPIWPCPPAVSCAALFSKHCAAQLASTHARRALSF